MTDNELFFWAIVIIILAIVVISCMDEYISDKVTCDESRSTDRYNATMQLDKELEEKKK